MSELIHTEAVLVSMYTDLDVENGYMTNAEVVPVK